MSQDPKEVLPESIYEQCKNTEFWRNLNEEIDENSDADSVEPTINNTEIDDSNTKLIGG